MLFGKKPNISNLRIFGSLAYAKNLSHSKLDVCSDKCVLLGYLHNGYKLLTIDTRRIIFVHDVIFNEKMLYKDLKISNSNNSTIIIPLFYERSFNSDSINTQNKESSESEPEMIS